MQQAREKESYFFVLPRLSLFYDLILPLDVARRLTARCKTHLTDVILGRFQTLCDASITWHAVSRTSITSC